MPSLLQRLKERKLFQWALAYLAGAWLIFQGIEVLAEPWNLSEAVQRTIHVLLGVGIFVTLILAWYHGEKGRQRASGVELLILAGILVIAGAAVAVLGRGEDAEREQIAEQGATSSPSWPRSLISVSSLEHRWCSTRTPRSRFGRLGESWEWPRSWKARCNARAAG